MDKCENKVLTYHYYRPHSLSQIDIIKEVLAKGLKGKKYLLGDQFSAADVVVGYSVWFMYVC